MLQQTQVDRVIPFYKSFIKKYPTAKKLAAAPLPEVLKSWQGLGYNRRAKQLRAAAQALATKKPCTVPELESLAGVGPYTARAVAAFAFNEDVVVIETNIRTAVIHHFFPKRKKVSDVEIGEILQAALPKGRVPRRQGSAGQAREWYSALMDYGAHLKRSGVSHNAKSKTYTKQSKFTGSLREARGAILREYTKGITSRVKLTGLLGPSRKAQMKTALEALIKEGLVI
ncbi:MAG: A/G-specific adenine glycosylase [Minisyncoccia bacterium]